MSAYTFLIKIRSSLLKPKPSSAANKCAFGIRISK